MAHIRLIVILFRINKDFKTHKIVRTVFFKYAGQSKSSIFTFMDTPMDYLNEVLNKIPRSKHTKVLKLEDICCKGIKTRGYYNTQISFMKEVFNKAQRQINGARMNYVKGDKESERKTENIIRWVKNGLIDKMKNKNIIPQTMRVILFKLNKDFKNCKMLVLSVLFVTHKKMLLECLKSV
ncbi:MULTISPECIES: hypothetical protein [Clostridium]|uniref:hypothetical protein n=1 Tax=Clostridium TaxID=1485 RepID=UPI000824BFD4|nr:MULTISPECIES: hypothetical protein [Clostridium]